MIKMGSQTYRALVILSGRGPMAAGDFGGDLWLGQKRGRTVSSNGGGDYAAQQFLGRLRKLGLVRTVRETDAWRGSSRWEITPEGRNALAKALAATGPSGELRRSRAASRAANEFQRLTPTLAVAGKAIKTRRDGR